MAEPQPPDVHEGAATPPAPATGAPEPANGAKKQVDGQALDKAMQGLGVGEKKKPENSSSSSSEDKKKNVKIEAADVALLVSELEVAKTKATELLRANDGDAVKAIRAYVMAAP